MTANGVANNGQSFPRNWPRALGSGVAGALALNLLHEGVRRHARGAPRMDILAMRALSGMLRRIGVKPPAATPLYRLSLIGDLLVNSVFYGALLLGRNRHPWLRGTVGGLLAGVGGVLLPPLFGLGRRPSGRSAGTKAMTLGWYLTGGLVAAGTYALISDLLDRRQRGGGPSGSSGT